jgi:hypothetical protein
MAEDTLSFVDVRFMAYNKNPDSNTSVLLAFCMYSSCTDCAPLVSASLKSLHRVVPDFSVHHRCRVAALRGL